MTLAKAIVTAMVVKETCVKETGGGEETNRIVKKGIEEEISHGCAIGTQRDSCCCAIKLN